MNIGVLFNDPQAHDRYNPDNHDNAEDIECNIKMQSVLRELDEHQFKYYTDHNTVIEALSIDRPQLVFNLCDQGFFNKHSLELRVLGLYVLELHVPAMLELLGLLYTGSPPTCLGMGMNKAFTRSLAMNMGIGVPDEIYVDGDNIPPNVKFPVFVKPCFGDGAMGITKDSLVKNIGDLKDRINRLREEHLGPLLLQQFLPGREYTVGVIGNPGDFSILPPLEYDYSHLDKSLPAILSTEYKFDEDSLYRKQINYKPAILTPDKKEALTRASLRMFKYMKCQDYARFDFREDEDGNIKMLEVNANPSWREGDELAIMAGFTSMQYSEFVKMILDKAMKRLKLKNRG